MPGTTQLNHWAYAGFDFNAVGLIVRTPVGPGQLPPLRGTDNPNAGIPGGLFVPKVHDTRPVTLDLWMPANSPSAYGLGWPGVQPMLDILATLFGDCQQHALTVYMPDGAGAPGSLYPSQGGPPTSGLTRTANAYVSVWAPADQNQGGELYIGTVTFILTDPYFYGTPIDTGPLSLAQQLSLPVMNPGNVATRNIQLYFSGPVTNPTVLDATNGLSLTLTGVAAGSGASLEVDIYRFACYINGVLTMGAVSHAGDASFMRFDPGMNMLQITATTYGAGTVEIVYQPAYL